MNTHIPLLFVILCFFFVGNTLCQQRDTILRTRADGTFRIVQFTDLHYGEGPFNDIRSAIVQENILKQEKPDLVVITGDAVSGYGWDNKQGWLAPLWKDLTQPMVDLNQRYAFTFGNHDDQADLTRKEIIALDQKNSVSLTQMGPANINGTTNYVLLVFSHNTSNPIPVAVLYMLDSSDENCEGVKGWGCVYPNQIAWYKNTAAALKQKYQKTIPALAFFHIPVPEFMNMWNNNTCQGKLQDTGVCCFSVNTGLFAAFKEMGDVVSVHCGHDHSNDFYGFYDGIMLAYGRKTGYGGYGPPEGWLRGSRVLQIHEDPFKLTHWIRQEDGSVMQADSQPVHAPASADQWHYCCDTVHGTESNCRSYAHQFDVLL